MSSSWEATGALWLAFALATGVLGLRAGRGLRSESPGHGHALWERGTRVLSVALVLLAFWQIALLCVRHHAETWEGRWSLREALLAPLWDVAPLEPPWPIAVLGLGAAAMLVTGPRSRESAREFWLGLAAALPLAASVVANFGRYPSVLAWELPLFVAFVALGPLRTRSIRRLDRRSPDLLPAPWALALALSAIVSFLPLFGKSTAWFAVLFWLPFLDALAVALGVFVRPLKLAFALYGIALAAWVTLPLALSSASPDRFYADPDEAMLAMLSPLGVLWIGPNGLLDVATGGVVRHAVVIGAAWVALRIAIAVSASRRRLRTKREE